MRRLILLPVGLVPAVLLVHLPTTTTRAEPAPPSCGTYHVDGGLAFGMAAVSVFSDEGPLPGREVFAVFSDSTGELVGDPAMLVTDADGVATMPAPLNATGVEFVTEAPPVGCVGEPEVIAVAVGPSPGEPGFSSPSSDLGPIGDAMQTTVPATVPTLGPLPVPISDPMSVESPNLGAVQPTGAAPEDATVGGSWSTADPAPKAGATTELARTGRGIAPTLGIGIASLVGGWWALVWRRRGGCRSAPMHR